MAPAIIGVSLRRISLRSQLKTYKFEKECSTRVQDARARRKLIDHIFQQCAQEKSNTINKTELTILLRDYSMQAFGADMQLSQDDVQFLFSLYDRPKTEAGTLNRQEIADVCNAWDVFLRKKDIIAKLANAYDAEGRGSIDSEELKVFLDSMNDYVANPAEEVPANVSAWIFQQSDVTKNGALSLLELSRAVCLFEFWTSKQLDGRLSNPLLRGVKGNEAVPPPVATPFPSQEATGSKFCVVS